MDKTHCDKCGKSFRIKPKTRTVKINIKETYFRCPHCKEKYIAFVMDGACRKLQREIKKLQQSKIASASSYTDKKITEDEYIKAIDAIENKIKQLQVELESKMDKLKRALT